MIHLNTMEQLVRKYFQYLVKEFGFTESGSNTEPFEHTIMYTKLNLIVEIIYGYRNEYIDLRISNKNFSIQRDSYKFIDLTWIMRRNKPDFNLDKNYSDLMPSKVPLEESLKILSDLFKIYAASILNNNEWYSWDEIAGYNYDNTNSEIRTAIEFNYKKSNDLD